MESQKIPSELNISPIVCRGVRGATTVTENTKEAILEATREMMYIMPLVGSAAARRAMLDGPTRDFSARHQRPDR